VTSLTISAEAIAPTEKYTTEAPGPGETCAVRARNMTARQQGHGRGGQKQCSAQAGAPPTCTPLNVLGRMLAAHMSRINSVLPAPLGPTSSKTVGYASPPPPSAVSTFVQPVWSALCPSCLPHAARNEKAGADNHSGPPRSSARGAAAVGRAGCRPTGRQTQLSHRTPGLPWRAFRVAPGTLD